MSKTVVLNKLKSLKKKKIVELEWNIFVVIFSAQLDSVFLIAAAWWYGKRGEMGTYRLDGLF